MRNLIFGERRQGVVPSARLVGLGERQVEPAGEARGCPSTCPQLSSTEKSVGPRPSLRMVSEISRLRLLAGSMMMYSDSSVSFRGLMNGIMSTCVSARVVKERVGCGEHARLAAHAPGVQGCRARKLFLRASSPCSASKCQAGIGVTVTSG